jgi:protein involved in polysaccharide export with SLBB domain
MKANGLRPIFLLLFPLVLGGLGGAPSNGSAQIPLLPPPGQAQQALQQAILQNPGLADSIRRRLAASGLTPEQIRARLAASGYPPDLLDQYLGPSRAGQAPVQTSALQLAAIQALGVGPVRFPEESLAVDTGLIRARGGNAPRSLVFGVDALRRTTTQFLPLLAGPAPPDYKLGPGDQLVLILTGDVKLAHSLPVTREGFILIPEVGPLFVSNLTLDQLRELIYDRLGRVYSGLRRGPAATTRFDVSVANVRVNQVYVVGEVSQPGAYQISALGTALTALYAAGGVTGRANMRRIEIQRVGKTVATVDLYDYLLRGDKQNDIRLETGDVVFVPIHGTRVQITGAVIRPAIYELQPTETLRDVIQAAGSFRADAARRRISIHRILGASEEPPGPAPRAVVDVSLAPKPVSGVRAHTTAFDGPDPKTEMLIPTVVLQDGDSVVVDSIPPLADVYHVAIAGMVNKPGMYGWHPGMTLRELVLLARGPKIGADLTAAEIARLPEDRSQAALATTIRVAMDSTYLFERDSLGRYLGTPGLPFPAGGTPEVPLQPYDNVLILKQPDFAFQRTVVLTGEVRYPGTYSLRTKTDRLADVIARAGGLTAQAYPDGVRFVRAVNNVGRINVNLPAALRDTTSRSNIILQPGDSIHVTEFQSSVRVTGGVNSPGSVLWEKGQPLDFYIDAAGGLSSRADKNRVSVTYANGTIRTRHRRLFGSSNPEPGPGSEVFVPVRDAPQGPSNFPALFAAAAQVLVGIATIIVVSHR